MKLVTFEINGRSAVGLLNADATAVHPVPGCADMQTLIGLWPALDTAAVLRSTALPLEQVRLLAPIPRPEQDVICLGINYFDHAKESERVTGKGAKAPDTFPIYFSKRVHEAVAPCGDIDGHSDIVADLDYEAELAVVIGRRAYNVSEAEALEYVFGYTILNDVSARTIQNQHKQWYRGKSLDGFTPMGPWIVTPEEFDVREPHCIRSRVNGELRQDSTTDRMIFHVAYVIAELSRGMTLLPGTIISMGTPAGVGMGFDPPKWLCPGDEVACSIEGIGTLTNTVR
ncbi:MAG: FAA hydrolase family protein [Clostridiales bacterium]|nr:FAA hydrolase family protein [Clostridiales bacterium]